MTINCPRPGVAADSAVFSEAPDGTLKILLVQRREEPFKDCWTLPGGFAKQDESVGQTAARELLEETGLRDVNLRQVRVFSDLGRDPRDWIISVLHTAVIPFSRVDEIEAGDDAADAAWWTVIESANHIRYERQETTITQLGFDHGDMVAAALAVLERMKRDTLRPPPPSARPFPPGPYS
jgi:8-oxo-dGTP diphosphatase